VSGLSPKPRLIDVLDTLGTAMQAALNNANISLVQIGPGQAISTELAQVIAQGNGNSFVALWPLKETDVTRYDPNGQGFGNQVRLRILPSGFDSRPVHSTPEVRGDKCA
jgi:hypothetical protein